MRSGQRLQLGGVGVEAGEGLSQQVEPPSLERRQGIGEDVSELGDVELLRQLGPAQLEQEVDEGVVAVDAEAEQLGVERRPVVAGRGVDPAPPVQRLPQPLGGKRPAAGGQVELVADPQRRHREPGVDPPARGSRRPQAHQGGDEVLDAVVVHPPELQPAVAQRRPTLVVGIEVDQVPVHGLRPVSERVEPLGAGLAVEHERQQQLQGLGLAGGVLPPQDQAAAGEPELLVVVLPDAEDPRPQGAEPARPRSRQCAGAADAFDQRHASVSWTGAGGAAGSAAANRPAAGRATRAPSTWWAMRSASRRAVASPARAAAPVSPAASRRQ